MTRVLFCYPATAGEGGTMNVLVHSKSLRVTEAMRTFAMLQASKISKVSQRVRGVNIFLETVKTAHGLEQEARAKVQLIIPGKSVMASSKAHDLYLAIHQAVEDSIAGIRKRKEKFLSRRAHKMHNLEKVRNKVKAGLAI